MKLSKIGPSYKILTMILMKYFQIFDSANFCGISYLIEIELRTRKEVISG